jgi:hypothetical protein
MPDDARRSGQTWVIGRGVPDDVGDVDGGDHAEMKGLDRVGKVEAAGELLGCGPSGRVGGGGRDGADLAGCADQRRVGAAGWAGEFAPTFRRPAPRHLVGPQRRHQSLENIAVEMALPRGRLQSGRWWRW